MAIRLFVQVKKNRLFFWAYNFDKYACNPRAITEYILDNKPNDFEIVWAFQSSFDTSCIDKRIRTVRFRSLDYYFALYSSRFVFTNKRNARFDTGFVKKSNQKYIMLWHGSFPLKKIEKDAENQLGSVYTRRAKDDSQMCDLMISDSTWFISLIKQSFWYRKEILLSGLPRNDIFYNNKLIDKTYAKIRQEFELPPKQKVVLYAPTFRDDCLLHYYCINWPEFISIFEEFLGGNVTIFIRLHPNMSKIKGIESIINDSRVINVTNAPDITPFLLAADAMISDYSSAMFDFCRLGRPCFMYAIDTDSYNRGFYWKWEELPFPLAKNQDELRLNIKNFNKSEYQENISEFMEKKWGLFENGHACELITKWIQKNL